MPKQTATPNVSLNSHRNQRLVSNVEAQEIESGLYCCGMCLWSIPYCSCGKYLLILLNYLFVGFGIICICLHLLTENL